MSNHTGTLFRILLIFLSLIVFWFIVSLAFSLGLVLLSNLELNLLTALSVFGVWLFVRVFYPRFIFKD